MQSRERWSVEMDAAIARLAESRTAKEIADRLGVTRNAVIGRANRLGIGLNHWYGKVRKRYQRRPRKRDLPKLFKPKPRLPPRTRPPPPPDGIPLMELDANSCRWPVGEAPDHRFCGQWVGNGAVYCAAHEARAWRAAARKG